MEHSKTPWRIGAMESGQVAVDDADGREVTGWISADDGARIVACVNACAGISTDNLEQNLSVLELARRYNAVLRQRDQLLAALKLIMQMDVNGHALQDRLQFSTAGRAILGQCQAAIAKAKGNDQ